MGTTRVGSVSQATQAEAPAPQGQTAPQGQMALGAGWQEWSPEGLATEIAEET